MNHGLIPCKKCGETEISLDTEMVLFNRKLYYIECKNCEDTEVRGYSLEKATEKWNKYNRVIE